MGTPKELQPEELAKRWHVRAYYSTDAGFCWVLYDREKMQDRRWETNKGPLQKLADRLNRPPKTPTHQD